MITYLKKKKKKLDDEKEKKKCMYFFPVGGEVEEGERVLIRAPEEARGFLGEGEVEGGMREKEMVRK